MPTHTQLEYLNSIAFRPESGARAGALPCAMIVIDNPSDDIEATLIEAKKARDEGVEIVVVGIGDAIDDAELEGIAGDTGSWWHIPSFEALPALRPVVIEELCQGQ